MSKRRTFLWIYEGLLVLALIRGLFAFGRSDVSRGVIAAAVAVNLFLQYGIIQALRRMPIDQLPPTEQAVIATRQKAVLKFLLIGGGSFFFVSMINIGLFVRHVYSIMTFTYVTMAAAALTFCFFLVSFTRLQKKTGIGISHGS